MNLSIKNVCCVLPLLVLAATVGCQDSATSPQTIASLADAPIIQRGKLQFIGDAVAGCQLAEQKGLPCLLFFTAEWCTFCHQMEETAFTDPKVEELAQSFVCVLVDADREPEICRQFNVSGYPTVQFISSDGCRLHRLVGRQSTPKLAAGMQAALHRLAWLDNIEPLRR